MTAIVGVLCSDGVVIGSDSSITFGQGTQLRTIEQPSEKLYVIDEHIIVAGTGELGFGQRFAAIIKHSWGEDKLFRTSGLDVGRNLCKRFIDDLHFTHMQPGSYGSLVAYPVNKKPFLCEFALQNFQPELKTERLWYASMGITQTITDSFLALIRNIFWSEGIPNIQEGIFAVTWALEHAILVNPGGVNAPSQVAVLERDKKGDLRARLLANTELDEHSQAIREAKRVMCEWRKENPDQPEIPDIPPK